MTPRKSAPAWNAGGRSRATRTCGKATGSNARGGCGSGRSSNATGWRRFNAACESKSHGFARSLVPPFSRHDVNARHKPWHDKSHWIAMTRKKGHRDSDTPGGSQRQLRVGELVRHAMAEMLTRGDVHDPVIEGHLITVPEVRMTPDLRLATIYIMPLAGRDADEVLAAFERHKKFLRWEIGHRVNLKFAPDIRFRVDERFAEAERIDKLLRSPAVKRDLEHEDDE